jgi:hypothetical protein
MLTLQPVDRLEFQILIDNLTDSLSTVPTNVTLEWPALMRAGMRQLSGRCQCCANRGLAVVVKAFRGTASRAGFASLRPSSPRFILSLIAPRHGSIDCGVRERIVGVLPPGDQPPGGRPRRRQYVHEAAAGDGDNGFNGVEIRPAGPIEHDHVPPTTAKRRFGRPYLPGQRRRSTSPASRCAQSYFAEASRPPLSLGNLST